MWLNDMDEGAALADIVCNYFHFGVHGNQAEWHHISTVDISPPNGIDPVWIVTAVKPI